MEHDAIEPRPGGLEPEAAIPVATQAQIDQAESLIRQAAVARRRNEFGQSRRLIEEAEKTAPGSVVVLEALGDLLVEQKKWTQAKEMFEKAKALDPQNISVERKFGECVLNLYVAGDILSNRDDSLVGGKAAVILSLFVPGLGQLASEQYQKGSMMLGGWALGWALAWLVPGGMQGLMGAMGLGGRGSAPFNALVLLPIAIAVVFHLWAIFDAANKAGHYRTTKIERPVPPIDKDFEI